MMTEDLRRRMGETAVRIGRLAGYCNAGTVEFLVEPSGSFYFLEMNTRLQVEHPITELVIGIDLVKEQIRISAGGELRLRQEDVQMRGAAIECRIYAEDPINKFLPSPGYIERLQVPGGPGVRRDSGVYEGWTVPVEYDPLLSKITTWGSDRDEAIARMRRALSEYEVFGIKTNILFFRRVLEHPDFLAGRLHTGFIDGVVAAGLMQEEPPSPEEECVATLAAALHAGVGGNGPGVGKRDSGAATTGNRNWVDAGREALMNQWPPRAPGRRW
jgi:acetyl-CoA carboxylase biotin carboxylase subunit